MYWFKFLYARVWACCHIWLNLHDEIIYDRHTWEEANWTYTKVWRMRCKWCRAVFFVDKRISRLVAEWEQRKANLNLTTASQALKGDKIRPV